MTPVEIIRVFVASPDELAEERRLLEEVVNELNLTWGDTLGVRLELVKWETHAYPNFGADAQDVIDGQIGDNYDIFVGILWTKFGTRTRAAASGTEQEFGRAYSRYKRSPDELRIMFYFKEAAVTPAQFDAAQLLKVQEFKKELGQLGSLYWPFKTLDEFANLARVHLTRQVQTWRKSWGTRNKLVSEPAHEPVDAVQNRPYDQIADLGFLELVEVSQDSFRGSH